MLQLLRLFRIYLNLLCTKLNRAIRSVWDNNLFMYKSQIKNYFGPNIFWTWEFPYGLFLHLNLKRKIRQIFWRRIYWNDFPPWKQCLHVKEKDISGLAKKKKGCSKILLALCNYWAYFTSFSKFIFGEICVWSYALFTKQTGKYSEHRKKETCSSDAQTYNPIFEIFSVPNKPNLPLEK